MSFGVSSTSLFGSTSTSSDGSSGISLRLFADLDLSEDQRTKIRSILKNAQSQGTSSADVESQIEAVLTSTQLATLQSNIEKALSTSIDGSSTSSTSNGSSSSSSSSSTTSGPAGAPPPGGPPGGNPFTDPNGPFANLNLTSTQQTQIASILSDAKSEGLTFDQVNAKIKALLTTSQQATFATDLQNLPAPPNGGSSGSSSTSDLFDNLNLTSDQKSQIEAILQNAQQNGTSAADTLSQIEAVLSDTQKATFTQDVQTAQAYVSGRSSSGSDGSASSSSSSTATISNGLTETDIQNQVAAANVLILHQLQSEVGALA